MDQFLHVVSTVLSNVYNTIHSHYIIWIILLVVSFIGRMFTMEMKKDLDDSDPEVLHYFWNTMSLIAKSTLYVTFVFCMINLISLFVV